MPATDTRTAQSPVWYDNETRRLIGNALVSAGGTETAPPWVPGIKPDGQPYVMPFGNHLFIYGSSNMGRTSLLRSFIWQIATENSEVEVNIFDEPGAMVDLAQLETVSQHVTGYQTATGEPANSEYLENPRMVEDAVAMLQAAVDEHDRRLVSGGSHMLRVVVLDDAELVLGDRVHGSAATKLAVRLIGNGTETGVLLVASMLRPVEVLTRLRRTCFQMSLPTRAPRVAEMFGDPEINLSVYPLYPGDLSLLLHEDRFVHLKVPFADEPMWSAMIAQHLADD